MAQLCPICRTATFEAGRLEDDLPTEMCGSCHGHWITSARYFAYLPSSGAHCAVGATEAVADLPTIKLCPACMKFMHYYPVGHGVAFGIDKCNTCGGVWLNAGEWESLAARNLHQKLHAISSDVWQAQVHAQRRTELEREVLRKKLGPEDFAQLEKVVQWLTTHPCSDALLAYVREHVRR